MTQSNDNFFGRILSKLPGTRTPPIAPQPLHRPPVGTQDPALPVPPLSELGLLLQALKAPATPARGAGLQTLVSMTLDESGSMQHGVKQTCEGYNTQLATLKANAEQIGCRVLQVNFSALPRMIAEFVPASGIVALSGETYSPSGGTGLYDTVVTVVKKLLSHPLAHDDNTSILLAVTTDGDDTASNVWNTGEGLLGFRELMKAVNQNERWTVTLSGPDTKLRQFADEMSVERENLSAFEPESIESRSMAMAGSAHAIGSYSAMRASGLKKSADLYAGTASGARAKAIMDQGTKSEGKDKS